LEKLVREAIRLEQAKSRDDKSDHAINGATTGWHLHEWVWAEMKRIERADPPDSSGMDADTAEQIRLQHKETQRACAQVRVDVAAELGISVGDVDARAFGIYMAKRYPAIEICRIIATGSKHTQVGDLAGAIVETYVSAGTSIDPATLDIVFTNIPKVKINGLVYGSSDILRQTEAVWTDFIYSRRIG
jgi:hypothetical protein